MKTSPSFYYQFANNAHGNKNLPLPGNQAINTNNSLFHYASIGTLITRECDKERRHCGLEIERDEFNMREERVLCIWI